MAGRAGSEFGDEVRKLINTEIEAGGNPTWATTPEKAQKIAAKLGDKKLAAAFGQIKRPSNHKQNINGTIPPKTNRPGPILAMGWLKSFTLLLSVSLTRSYISALIDTRCEESATLHMARSHVTSDFTDSRTNLDW